MSPRAALAHAFGTVIVSRQLAGAAHAAASDDEKALIAACTHPIQAAGTIQAQRARFYVSRAALRTRKP